jgi:WD40 repeat protein
VESGKELKRFEGHTDSVYTVAFAPNGRILSGGADKTIRVWDVESKKEIGKFAEHTGYVMALVVLPNGRIMSASKDATARLWELPK